MRITKKALALDQADCTLVQEASSHGLAMTLDERWFRVFYDRTAAPLRAYAVRVLGNPGHADDIVQESYMRFMRTPPATDDPRVLRAFLFQIASRLMIDKWRRERHEREAGTTDEHTPGAPGPDIPLRLDMERVFGQLSPQQRQLLWLAYAEGADHREIAQALGVRERSVRVLLFRARRKVAGLLRGDPREGGANE